MMKTLSEYQPIGRMGQPEEIAQPRALPLLRRSVVRHRPGLSDRRRGHRRMKLARFGEPGAERPGVILDDGTRIDVSGQVRDYDEAFFAGDGMGSCVPGSRTRRWLAPRCQPPRASAARSRGPARSSASGSTSATTPRRAAWTCRKSRSSSSRPRPRWSGPTIRSCIPRGGSKLDWEVELAIVIGRARLVRGRSARARPRRRLRAAQRLLRARVPARTRRPVGQGQERGHVRADRPVPRHARRDPRSAGARHVAHRQRRDAAAGDDREHGVRRRRRSSATSASS